MYVSKIILNGIYTIAFKGPANLFCMPATEYVINKNIGFQVYLYKCRKSFAILVKC